MPQGCNEKSCLECESHAIVSGKLDCNYMNRLGLAQPTVKTFLHDDPTPEPEQQSLSDIDEELRKMEEQRQVLLKKKQEQEAAKGSPLLGGEH
jgi:hypothetical protein